MDAVDMDAHIARIESEDGPEAAAGEAAYAVLLAVYDFDLLCLRHHPDSGYAGQVSLAGPSGKTLAETIANDAVVLLTCLRRLNAFLQRESLWTSLCMANSFPAKLGVTYGPFYAEIAFRLGESRYSDIYGPLSPGHILVGRCLDEFPTITGKDIIKRSLGGLEGFIRSGADTAPGLNLREAKEHLAKEIQRATSRLPQTGANATASRDAVPYEARFRFPSCPKCGGQSKGTGTKNKVRYAKCTNAKCSHSFKLSKSSS